jgi:hypothetical protein
LRQESDLGQQLRQPFGRRGWKPPKHIRQVAERIDTIPTGPRSVTRNLFAAILDRIARLAMPPPVVVGRMPA